MEYEYLASNNKGLSKEITRRVVRRPVPQTEIKKAAQSRIDEMKVNDIKPYTFRLAERRYAKLAGELLVKGDIAGAFDAKQKELFNFELYNESVKAKEFSKKHVKDVKKFFKKDEDLVKTREIDFINAGRAILSRYGLGKTDKEPLQYLSKIKEYNPDAYETISGIVTSIVDNPDDYKNISYGQFVDLIDVLNSLWHLSKDVKEIEIDGKKVQIESAAEELLSQAEVFKKPKKQEKYNRTATDSEKLRKGLLGVKAMLQRFEHWVDVMDLGNVSGPFKKYLYQQVSDASDQYLTERKKYKEKIVKLSEPIRKSMDLTKKIESPELNFEFKNKAELLGALLHVGNESNLKKLLVGREWGALNEDGSVNTSNWDKFLDRMHRNGTLTKADWDYIQALWDLMEDIKPMAQKAHRKVFGFYFNEITSQKVNTPFGEYRGGYAPAAIDPDAVTDIARKAELEEFIKGHNSYTYPAAGGRGFTKNRVENFNKPLNLDIGLVVKHVDDVLRFSIIKPKVVDSAKIIMNQNFKSGIGEIDPVVIEKLIKPALNRADKNTIQNVDPAGSPLVRRLGSMLRANASMQLMFANAVNTAEQVAGFAVASTRISPRALMKAGYRYLHNPGFHANQIKELSTFMNTRTDDQIFEMEKQSQKIFSEESNFEKVRTWSQKHAFFMQAWTQNFMDNIIWSGSYDESLSKGLSEKEAIRKADADIRMTQSSRRPLDVANIETNATLNFFQMFMNFFNTMANLNAANFQKLYYEDMGLKSKFYKGMYLYIMGYASIAVISAAIRKAAAGGLDEDDDGEYIDDLYDVFIGSQIDLGLAMIPAVGPAVNAGINRLNDKVYDDRVSASPAISSISSIVGTTGKLATGQLTDDKGIKGDVRDGITGLGVVTGLPLGGLNRPVGYVIDVNTGKARPKGPLDITRGLITGKPGTR